MSTQATPGWWRAGVNWSLAALLVVLVGGVAIPYAAARATSPMLDAMASHTYFLYWAAAIMVVVGWVDSALLYRRTRGGRR